MPGVYYLISEKDGIALFIKKNGRESSITPNKIVLSNVN
jgi:hypothetical protein